jgi:adenylate kinase family enzyme
MDPKTSLGRRSVKGLIIFFGPPGAGKSVQAGLLAAEVGYTTVSTGALLRAANNPELQAKMSTGELVDADFVNNKIAELIKQYAPSYHLIVDGTPRSVEQAEWLVMYAADNNVPIHSFVHLYSNLETSKKRLLKRGRFDDELSVIGKRFAEYEEVREQLMNVFTQAGVKIIEVNGDDNMIEIRDEILEQVAQSMGPRLHGDDARAAQS